MNTETESPEENVAEADAQNQSLEQIREILFGTKTRDIDERLEDLHNRVFDAIGELRTFITERSNSINQKLEKEVGTLHDELAESRRQADSRMRELDSKFINATNDLRQQIGALGETLSGTEASVRDDMTKGMEELRQNFSAQMDQVREQIQHDVARLTNATVSRRSFSEALRQLSSQFDDD